MTTIVTKTSKGAKLTHAEVDANWENLNTDKIERDGSIPFTGNLDVGGFNIVSVSLVDGRDVASDGTKLDGIESGATADQTDAEIETAYNNQVAKATQTEAENSSNTTVYRWAPQQVWQTANQAADDAAGKIRGIRELTTSGNTVADDRGKIVEGNNASAMTITLDDDIHGLYDVIYIVQEGAGQVTIAADTNGTLVYADDTFVNKTLEQGAVVTVICVDATPGANVFRLGGQLALL